MRMIEKARQTWQTLSAAVKNKNCVQLHRNTSHMLRSLGVSSGEGSFTAGGAGALIARALSRTAFWREEEEEKEEEEVENRTLCAV